MSGPSREMIQAVIDKFEERERPKREKRARIAEGMMAWLSYKMPRLPALDFTIELFTSRLIVDIETARIERWLNPDGYQLPGPMNTPKVAKRDDAARQAWLDDPENAEAIEGYRAYYKLKRVKSAG